MKTIAPPVTVLMPVRNAMPYLRETLASLVRQTYRNFELITWVNGSTDGTVEELNRWVPSRVPGRIVSTRPLSLGAARAALVEEAATDLCAVSDADDIHHPQRLERQVAFLEAHPEVGLVGGQIHFIDEQSELKVGAWRFPLDDADIRWRLRFCNSINQPTAMFRRSAALAAGNYRDVSPSQDYDLWVRLATVCRMANLSDELVHYRLHARSVSHGKKDNGGAANRAIIATHVREVFPWMAPRQAMELRDVLMHSTATVPVWRHIRQLRTTAKAAAIAVDEPRNYFIRTELYRMQHRFLWREVLKRRTPLGYIWPKHDWDKSQAA